MVIDFLCQIEALCEAMVIDFLSHIEELCEATVIDPLHQDPLRGNGH